MLTLFIASQFLGKEISTEDLARIPNDKLSRDICAVVRQNCIRCHTGNPEGVFSLGSASNLRRYARGMVGEVLGKRMPPGVANSSVDHFMQTSALTSFDVSELWEWSNRVEQGKITENDLKDSASEMSPPKVSTPAPSIQIVIPVVLPAEASGGLTVIPFTVPIPRESCDRAITDFWVTSNWPGRVVRSRLSLDSVRLGWSFNNRPWHSDAKGPCLPNKLSGQLEVLADGMTHKANVCLNFVLGPVIAPKERFKIAGFRQETNISGRRENIIDHPVVVYGFHPSINGQIESLDVFFSAGGSSRVLLVGQPAVVSHSVGTYYLQSPIRLPAKSALGFSVQFRRNHSAPIALDWILGH